MKEKTKDTIAAIFEQVDPMEAMIMILGGTAAVNGIVPPLTRLLMTFVGGETTSSDNVKKDIAAAQLLTIAGIPLGIPGLIIQFLAIGSAQAAMGGWTQTSGTEKEEKAQVAALGLFCSGAIEAMIMYKFVSNPEVMKAMIALPGQVLQGAGKLVPAVIPV